MIENQSKSIGNTRVIKAPDLSDGFTLYRDGGKPLAVGNHDGIEVVTLGRFSCFKCTDILMGTEYTSYVSEDGGTISEEDIQKKDAAAEAEAIYKRLMGTTNVRPGKSTSSISIYTSNKPKPASVITGNFQPPNTGQLFLNFNKNHSKDIAVNVPA